MVASTVVGVGVIRAHEPLQIFQHPLLFSRQLSPRKAKAVDGRVCNACKHSSQAVEIVLAAQMLRPGTWVKQGKRLSGEPRMRWRMYIRDPNEARENFGTLLQLRHI